MGSHQSTLYKQRKGSKLPDTSVLFSEFCKRMKESSSRDKYFARKIESNLNLPAENIETMEVVVHLWFMKCLSTTKWQKLGLRLKNKLIRDFLNTLYCTSHAFDELFLLVFTNPKSRSFIIGHYDQFVLSSNELHNIVEEMLRYSSSADLKYCTHASGHKRLEKIVDFPLKTFSLCPCTRRPLYVAMFLSRPDVVKLLLKCGAKIPYEDSCHCLKDPRHPLRNVMEVLKVSNEKKTDSQSALVNYQSVRREKNVMSLKLILVDIKHSSSLYPDVCDTLRNLGETEEEYSSVPSLKHICRTKIRQTLREGSSFCSPNVWQSLCLPKTLISYLDLDDFHDISHA